MTVVENFDGWDEWFGKDKKVKISDLPKGESYNQNMGVVLKTPQMEMVPKSKDHGIVKGEYLIPVKKYYPCAVKPANTEQTFALELLRDDSIPLVSLLGAAGGGKNYLACAHMMHALKKGLTSKLVLAKSLTPVGREIGYLKGGLEDKVVPWLGSFFDNLQKLGIPKMEIEDLIAAGLIEISPITFIQGRSISNSIICVDEVQNLEMDVLKQIITRAGEGSKILLLGDPTQRFERGKIDLDKFLEKGKASPLVGHINFLKSIRSEIAQWAVDNM